MKYKILLILTVFHASTLFSQTYRWGLDLYYFFDNTEYDKSSYIDAGTMHGVWLDPKGSITWDNSNSINAGLNLLLIPGNKKTLEKVDLTMYYQYEKGKTLFRVGAFPRKDVLSNYDSFLFKDSVNNFIPQMQGVFWQIGNDRNFINAWMDWTGYASPKINENFFVGLSGKVSKGICFADFQSYMFHHALTKPVIEGQGVSENLQMQAMVGVEYEGEQGLKGLLSAGTLMGYERDRRFENSIYKPMGFAARLQLEYWGIGTKNSLYIGNPRMLLYDEYGGNLYWGTQFLRDKRYLKSEWYIRLIENRSVSVVFNSNMHLSEKKLFFQQMLTVKATIGNIRPKNMKNTDYPWKKCFK